MKKLVSLVLIALLLLSTMSCSSERTIKIDGVRTVVPYYGAISADEERRDDVVYEASIWNVVMGIIFVETIIAPVYIFGFNTMKPVRQKTYK